MDRTMMDRTIMDNYRADEKELSDKLHSKIEKLIFINAPTEEFKKIFIKDMFLKPNPKAFFHVMHYLFVCLDQVEFKKRFYWPIIDKKSETNFRSSTVEYLNYLNKKHNLQWTQLKNYIVLVPGGYKFLKFLNDFLDFIAGELVKQREKYLTEKLLMKDLNLININFNQLKAQKQCLRVNALRYSEAIESHTTKLKEKIDMLRKIYVKISNIVDIPVSVLMDHEFIENFLEFGKDILKEKITKKVDEFVSTEKNINGIVEDIKIYKIQKTELTFDRNKLLSTFNHINAKNHKFFGNILCGNEINFEILVNIFEHILPEIQNLLSTLDQNFLDQLTFEENNLTKLNSEFIQLDNDIVKYSISLNDDIRSNQTRRIKTTPKRCISNDNNFHSKFINTPPIPQYRNLFEGGIKKRLCLMDDYNTNNVTTMNTAGATNSGDYFSFANNQTTFMQMKTPAKNRNDSTLNRSKIMDPKLLLQSLTKPRRPHGIGSITNKSNANLSILAKKWKENETSFFGSNDKSILETSNEYDETSFDFNKAIHSKMTTTVRKKQIPDIRKKLHLDQQQSFLKSTNSPTNIIVQQVQNTSLDFSKLNTSPSGRLDSLIKINPNDLPKILLNDLSMTLNSSANVENLPVENIIPTNCVKENDIENVSDIDLRLNLSSIKDSIFNVSDTILKDISD